VPTFNKLKLNYSISGNKLMFKNQATMEQQMGFGRCRE
jgi:hypothetical protein